MTERLPMVSRASCWPMKENRSWVAPAGTEISTGYVNKYDDAKSTGFYEARIRGLYTYDPEQHMFWPIFNDTMTNSQGYIKNDYGYDSI